MGPNGIQGTREKDGETRCNNSVGQLTGIKKTKTFGDIMMRPSICSGAEQGPVAFRYHAAFRLGLHLVQLTFRPLFTLF